MGSKNKSGNCDCYAAAEPDEPMFILLGRDPMASAIVQLWVEMRRLRGGCSQKKMDEATMCADAMRKWAIEHGHGPDIVEAINIFRCACEAMETKVF